MSSADTTVAIQFKSDDKTQQTKTAENAACNGHDRPSMATACNVQATDRPWQGDEVSPVGQTLPTIDEKVSEEDQNKATTTVTDNNRPNDSPTTAGGDGTRPRVAPVPAVLRRKYAPRPAPGQLLEMNVDDSRYRACLARIRQRLVGKKIWASLDETADPKHGEVVGHVVFGTLSPDGPGETYLLASGVLRRGGDSCTDAGRAVARLFDGAVRLLWPDGGGGDLRLLVSGLSAVADCEAMADWPAVGPKTVLVACVARQLRAVAERISADYPTVDSLVSMMHRAFPGDQARPQVGAAAGSSCPWIESVSYLNENFAAVRGVLFGRPDRRVSWPVWQAGRLTVDPKVEPGLAFVDLNYGFLPAAVAQVQARGAPLTRTVAAVFRAADRLAEVAGELGAAVHRRFEDALRDNRGFRVLARIADVMAGRSVTMDGLPEHLSGNDLKYFKYAPVAAVHVRKAFPAHETIFSKYNRLKYDEQSLNKLLVVQCNVLADDDDDDAADSGAE